MMVYITDTNRLLKINCEKVKSARKMQMNLKLTLSLSVCRIEISSVID